jgi:hypothetical protein
MPITKVDFTPGLNKDDTPLASEGGWTDAQWVRWVRGRPQLMGGYDSVVTSTFTGIARGAHAWYDMAGQRYVAWGTAAKLYALIAGVITDITPPHSEGVLTNPFTTTSGSATVSVAHTGHALATGDSVTLHASAGVGSLSLSGTYTITVTDANTYTITASGNAAATATGGGTVDYVYTLTAGLVDGAGDPGGYGTGTYGSGGYGSTTTADRLPRIWFLDNYGESLVAVPRGGGLYEFQPELSYPELVSNGGFSSSSGWTLGTGWTIGAGVATAAAGSASDLSTAVAFEAGRVYRVTFTATLSAGTFTIATNGGSIGEAGTAVQIAGTYSRLFRAPVGSTTLKFSKDNAYIGTIDNVSIKLESVAYRVDEAPTRNDAMFVDPHQIIVLMGTNTYGGNYNPLAVRWNDRQQITVWTPTTANLAGDDILAIGGRLVAGLATRQQNLVWSDSALYTMQFTNDASDPFVFRLAGTGCGLIGALAAAEHNGLVAWMSRDNFYSFQGTSPTPIASKLRRDVFENIAENQGEKIACGINSAFSEVWWLYPDGRDGNECSRYAAFAWTEEGAPWTAGTLTRSSWIKSGVYEYPIAFGTNGMVYYHEKGTSAAGAVLTGYLVGSYFDVGDGDRLVHIKRIIPDFEDALGPISFTVYGRMWPSAPEMTFGPYTYNDGVTPYQVPMRATARQIKFRLDTSSTPAFWRLGTFRIDAQPSGAKR